ncbi:MAG: YARHG domain-containing protein, partial [Alphaproteobacteria bacterium]
VAAFAAALSAAVALPAAAESPEFDRCLDRATGETAAAQCYYAEGPRQQARLQAAYETLLASQYSEVDRQRLRAAQTAWVAYRDAHCAWEWALPWGDMPDDLIPIACAMRENERRADELVQLMGFFGGGIGDIGEPAGDAATSGAGFIIPDSSQRALTRADLAGLSPSQLRIARNEIYARHGYIFQNAELQAWFSAQPWYTPISRQVTLSRIEEQNVALLRAVEEGR